jgi:hypothetical protein
LKEQDRRLSSKKPASSPFCPFLAPKVFKTEGFESSRLSKNRRFFDSYSISLGD